MTELGVEKVLIDRISGKNTDRPELKRMMGFVRQGGITAVEAMKRLDMKPSTFYRKVKEAGI